MTIDIRKNSAMMSQAEWLRASEVLKLIRDFGTTDASKYYSQSIDELGQGNYRGAINLSWVAFDETPKGCYLRFHTFQHHCRVLIGNGSLVSLQDMIYLHQVAQDKQEETLCRVEALQVLGELKGIVVGDVGASVVFSKMALEVANQATPRELEQKIFLNSEYDVSVGEILEEFSLRCLAMLDANKTATVGVIEKAPFVVRSSFDFGTSLEETKMEHPEGF
ncbi:expressed unknown protein [Seminavis robusta]|uniref:Uncharacterized protein n=1 Tax=Seminavis robusta TaxID=568900 RepID=A0A9N8EDW3_9STRA|nr:expressed unknown protein [Seminavis robusta]|eukprot:Sro1034_g233820.1 n/a (221) ;mRNA; f:12134-12796